MPHSGQSMRRQQAEVHGLRQPVQGPQAAGTGPCRSRPRGSCPATLAVPAAEQALRETAGTEPTATAGAPCASAHRGRALSPPLECRSAPCLFLCACPLLSGVGRGRPTYSPLDGPPRRRRRRPAGRPYTAWPAPPRTPPMRPSQAPPGHRLRVRRGADGHVRGVDAALRVRSWRSAPRPTPRPPQPRRP